MIQAIIFDCFGVLSTDGWLPFKAKYFAHDKSKLLLATDLNKQADAGQLSYSEFTYKVAELAGITHESAQHQIENNVPNEPLFDYIKSLKSQYKIGMLSNAAANWLDRIFSEAQLKLFDATALSYETGYIKPMAGAYETIANRLKVAPDQCVFIDDQQRYCSGAIEAGMAAIMYRDVEQTRAEIDNLLI